MELGLTGVQIPENYGGQGLEFVQPGIVLEELGGHLHFRSTQLPLPLPRQPRAKHLSRCFPYAHPSLQVPLARSTIPLEPIGRAVPLDSACGVRVGVSSRNPEARQGRSHRLRPLVSSPLSIGSGRSRSAFEGLSHRPSGVKLDRPRLKYLDG